MKFWNRKSTKSLVTMTYNNFYLNSLVQNRFLTKQEQKSAHVLLSPLICGNQSQFLKKTHAHPHTLPEKPGLIPGSQHKLHPPLTQEARAMEQILKFSRWGQRWVCSHRHVPNRHHTPPGRQLYHLVSRYWLLCTDKSLGLSLLSPTSTKHQGSVWILSPRCQTEYQRASLWVTQVRAKFFQLTDSYKYKLKLLEMEDWLWKALCSCWEVSFHNSSALWTDNHYLLFEQNNCGSWHAETKQRATCPWPLAHQRKQDCETCRLPGVRCSSVTLSDCLLTL